MNINQMMKQAQQMQANVKKAQDELEKKEFEHEVQGIKVKVSGSKQVLSVNIDADLLDEDNKEILEDMLVVALNDVFAKVDQETEAIMSKATGNMKIPGL
ncbi:DNA-binding YbaB/EbfC family protein [Bacilli bacterium PM5-3]|nr:DNA-binding YbaB/EbfC family protein [Bacilli bacterium PM5-3]MDH6604166.1 DNA-binding YbaB/EbfC family protein [Bacilli bacterium PM5-9]